MGPQTSEVPEVIIVQSFDHCSVFLSNSLTYEPYFFHTILLELGIGYLWV